MATWCARSRCRCPACGRGVLRGGVLRRRVGGRVSGRVSAAVVSVRRGSRLRLGLPGGRRAVEPDRVALLVPERLAPGLGALLEGVPMGGRRIALARGRIAGGGGSSAVAV